MKRIILAAMAMLFLSTGVAARGEVEQGPWPTVFELDRGQSITLHTAKGETAVKLLEVSHSTEPDFWTGKSPDNATFAGARVVVEVNGRREELLCRPYEMPKTLGGLRLYVETTKLWGQTPQLQGLKGVERDVRFSAVPEGKSWGPESLVFPVVGYRWRSSTYQNTWGSLVPFNLLYYHRGEDLGAIPDRLDLVAIRDGRVASSPLPKGDGRSNGLRIDFGDGATLRYAHMNLETIAARLTAGAAVRRGEPLAKTGCTWNGRRSQLNDPHVHLELEVGGMDVSFYPALVEAYFRTYDDAVLAIAGGYGFARVGGSYALDATRSLARPGRKIVAYRWRLHDGREVDGPQVAVRYDRSGYYAEELIVRADDGSEDRDAIHVRVYDPAAGKQITHGWAYYTPPRDIRPGTEVLLWNRLGNLRGRAQIDFGDGTPSQPIDREIRHAYRQAGIYTAAISGEGPGGEPVLLKLRVRVEAFGQAAPPLNSGGGREAEAS